MVLDPYLMSLAASGALTGGGLLGWLQLRQNLAKHRIDLPYTSVERLPTLDGNHVELRRLPGPDTGVPVLLVHGLAANHRNVDFDHDNSLARALASRGRDVWLLTLRSGRTDRRWAETRGVTFASMAEHDLPLAVAAVRERTSQERLDYVGFSMGGMLLYASLGRWLQPRWVRRAAIIGSPGRIASPVPLPSAARYLPFALSPTLWLNHGSNLVAHLSEWFHTPLHHLVCNPKNVGPGRAARSLVNVIVDVPGRLGADFARWATGDGEIRLPDGSLALHALRAVDIPAHFFAGAADRLAPPHAVRHAFDAWGSASGVDKAFTVLGSKTGARADYGHGDLAVGTHLHDDLFPPLARFLCS
jgi:polyhydroxyalkanoate synthase subunit PhaC